MGSPDKILRVFSGLGTLGLSEGFRAIEKQAVGGSGGEGVRKAEDRINRESELARRRRVAIASQARGRGSTLLGGAGGPQPAASRVTLLGNA